MKRFVGLFSLIIFVAAVSGISWITVYTLNHRDIKEEVETKKNKTIEKVTTNMGNDSLAEIYNVYLNKNRHKIKFEYSLKTLWNGLAEVELLVYFDGRSVLNEKVVSDINFTDIKSVFENETVDKYVRISEKNIKIIKDNGIDYLLFDVGYYNGSIIEKYFAFNEDTESILENPIVVRDSLNTYVNEDDSILDIFYNSEEQVMAKLEENVIFALVPSVNKKKYIINEYRFVIKDGKFQKELIKTYENIKLKESTTEKK